MGNGMNDVDNINYNAMIRMGARFERPDQMDSRFMVIDETHISANGYAGVGAQGPVLACGGPLLAIGGPPLPSCMARCPAKGFCRGIRVLKRACVGEERRNLARGLARSQIRGVKCCLLVACSYYGERDVVIIIIVWDRWKGLQGWAIIIG